MEKTTLSKRFKHFAVNECRGSSQLYEHLSQCVSEDEEMLLLCAHAREGQPVPNLFFGAVHYLLYKGKDHELKCFYGSIVESPEEEGGCFPYFKDFCQKYRNEIISIMENKSVQTNEVRRCSYLYPCFCLIYEKVKKPLALIEIGTSAGFQLLWDQYSYSYGTAEVYGNHHSDVHIKAENRGKHSLFLLPESPPVTYRKGLDLHVNNLNDNENYLWLKSLIWPNHYERRKLFERAAQEVTTTPSDLIEGDGVALLSGVVKEIPQDTAICIFHTHVANQMPHHTKRELLKKIEGIGQEREVFHLYNNIHDGDLHLDYFINGEESNLTIGNTDGHGRWFSWNLQR
ncbi:DUF2332 domain-containing protein [Salicibibacter cibarius]|uniref:DUF2332 domain-containing protein n=1 Tax=Salicibibacter cibarius TaxID=2743000 RepID=A0A7T6Z1M0_9BACI|nr:DUF2332 domain-containing protein [Salicibibacter cibarius]QQK75328.1 DUF2332 domain-containing protein [Salicibibacter cibarius]